MPLHLELNPTLDAHAHAAIYARFGIVRIPDLLSPASAETVAQILEHQLPWELHLSEKGDPAAVLERARSGFAFQYLSYGMIDAYLAGQDPGHPIHKVSEFLNGMQFLNLLRTVT